MFCYILLITATCLISLSNSSPLIQKRQQVCDNTWSLCSPTPNQTWYHHEHYTFVWNQNYTLFVNSNILKFDLHLLTQLTSNGTERTVKSWFNLTNNADLSVQVTDDWFPNTLPSINTNKTWTLYAFLLPHDAVLPPSINLSPKTNELITYEPYTQFNVVQFPPTAIVINKEKLSYKWIIVIIAIACIVVIIAICVSIWFWKNMQKKITTTTDSPSAITHHNGLQQSSILSTPDAMMIADTFRQVMSTPSDNKSLRRNQVGEDLLRRQLESEGTSVLEVERRTSSTKTKRGDKN